MDVKRAVVAVIVGQFRTEILDLVPPVVCVLAVNQAPAHSRPTDR